MKTAFTIVIVSLLFCAGCQPVARHMQICRVVETDTFKPIRGAKLWMQPYAPIHPFWPAGDQGVTDANGEVKLSLPKDFWWYFSSCKADGYSEVKQPEHPMPTSTYEVWVFYMSPNGTTKNR